jgi:hypothetical protein
MKKILAVAFVASLVATGAHAAPIALTNQGFETGDLTGWSTLGTVNASPSTNVVTFDGTNWTVDAAGTTMAQLISVGASQAQVEAFLGLGAGALTAGNANPNGGSLTNGAAISQDFSGNAGDVVTMFWNYVATDYIPFNDPSYAVVTGTGSNVSVLATIHGLGTAVGTSGNSGWQSFSYVLPADGTYKLGFATFNDKDTILNSYLHLDNVAGSCTPNCPVPVPEPLTFSLLGLGLALGASRAARRRQ